MSTRSRIILKDGDTYKSIYCHFDGYLEGVGDILLKNYNTPKKVRDLISMGDASSLGINLNGSTFYHRDQEKYDREEELVIRESPDLKDHNAVKDSWEEYYYLFENGRWSEKNTPEWNNNKVKDSNKLPHTNQAVYFGKKETVLLHYIEQEANYNKRSIASQIKYMCSKYMEREHKVPSGSELN